MGSRGEGCRDAKAQHLENVNKPAPGTGVGCHLTRQRKGFVFVIGRKQFVEQGINSVAGGERDGACPATCTQKAQQRRRAGVLRWSDKGS